MKNIKLILVTTVLTVLTTTTMADINRSSDDVLIPTGVRAELGTTGYGGAIQWTVNSYVGLSLGYNGGAIFSQNDLTVNGRKYDYDLQKNSMLYLNTELHPWGSSENRWAEAFYVATGVAYIDYKANLKHRIGANQIFSINGETFITREDGVNLVGSLKYRKIFAPYVGLGYAPKLGNHWGVFVEGGAYYTRSPIVRLKAEGQILQNAYSRQIIGDRQEDLQQAVRKDAREIENNHKYEWIPVAKLGVNFFW